MYPSLQVTKVYQIRYRAYSGGVCVNDKIKLITVNAVPKIQFAAIPNACFNVAPYLITQATETGNVPGVGVYSGLGIISSAGMFNPALAGIGTHTIKYVYAATAAGCVDSMTQTITVLDTASAKFSFTNPVCSGTPTSFTDLSTSPTGITLNFTWWNFGDGSPIVNHAAGTTFTHQFAGWGNYMVKMYNTSTYGCKSTLDSQNVYVSPIPQAAFTFGQSSVCLPNANVSVINNSAIADNSLLTYLWDFGDPSSGNLNTSTLFSPHHNYTTISSYVVKLITTSNSNCVSSFTDTVNFIHPQPKAAFTINKPSICIGDNITLTDSSNGLDGTITNWNWNFGDGNLSNTNPVQHVYTTAATFNISLFIINSNGCNSDTITKPFTVYPYPVIGTEATRMVLQGGSLILQPNVTGNITQYLWSPATYLDSTNIANPTASNMQDDIVYLLTVTGAGGCVSYDNITVKILKTPKIPNTFTPNGDGINDTWKIDYLNSYPTAKVQVFTRTGQVVFESTGYPVPWDGTYMGKPLPFDTYYYIIEPGSGRQPLKGFVTIVK